MPKPSKKSGSNPVAVQDLPTPNDNLAIDLGNAYSNLRGDNGLALDYRSIMAPLGSAARVGKWGEDDYQSVIGLGGSWYVTGDRCYTLAPDGIEEYPTVNRYTSTWYRVLFASALHRAFAARISEGVIYPRLIASIPAALFRNQAEVDKVRANLIGDYRIENVTGSALNVSIQDRKIVVIPEGIGTYFTFAFGGGHNAQFLSGTWAIVDSGYLTLDAVFVRDGDYMPELSRSDEKTGISIVSEKIREGAFNQTRTRLDRATIDRALECDILTVNQQTINLKDYKEKNFAALANRAARLIESWAAGLNLQGIILTGGGASYLYPHLESGEALPKIYLAQNPRRANVEGSYLYLTSED